MTARGTSERTVTAPYGTTASCSIARRWIVAGRMRSTRPRRSKRSRSSGVGIGGRPAGAVDDVAARRLDAHVPGAVLARLDEVLVAAEHLQEPEAEEHDGEQRERDPAEDGDAQRELRRDRGAPVLHLHGW